MKEIKLIKTELKRAKKIHPVFPDDIVHQAAIVSEEAGEMVQAALNYYYHTGSIECIEHELIQTGAMVLRMLQKLKGKL